MHTRLHAPSVLRPEGGCFLPADRQATFGHPGDAPALTKSSAGTGAEDSDGDSSGARLDIVIDGVDQPRRGEPGCLQSACS